MKTLSSNQIYFAATAIAATVLFRWGLSHFLSVSGFSALWISALVYFFTMFGSGWYFGQRDAVQLPLAVTALRYHLLTFTIFNVIAVIWELSTAGTINHRTWVSMIIWAAALLLHAFFFFLGTRQRIRGINKEEIFE